MRINKRIVQLLPADGWYIAIGDVGFGAESKVDASIMWERLVAWALYDDGSVGGLVLQYKEIGAVAMTVGPVDEEDGEFCGYAYEPTMTDAERKSAYGHGLVQHSLGGLLEHFTKHYVETGV